MHTRSLSLFVIRSERTIIQLSVVVVINNSNSLHAIQNFVIMRYLAQK